MQRRAAIFTVLSLASPATFALYDPKPDEALAAAQGEWSGSLTYRDYSKPDRMVTLPTRLFVALASPTELVLHFVFDDGPSKTVFSYERMQFDFSTKQVNWYAGSPDKPPQVHKIVALTGQGPSKQMVFERSEEDATARFTLLLSSTELGLMKEEIQPSGASMLRNRFAFKRPSSGTSQADHPVPPSQAHE
jgi:hypothetical protein